jgi:uncharacterized protein YdeI (YjbR/CyaY-like superfamily)
VLTDELLDTLGGKSIPVTVTIANDTEPRVIEVPADLAEAFVTAPTAEATWGRLTSSQQREYAEFITSAKRQVTRQRRVGQSVERLAAGTKSPTR